VKACPPSSFLFLPAYAAVLLSAYCCLCLFCATPVEADTHPAGNAKTTGSGKDKKAEPEDVISTSGLYLGRVLVKDHKGRFLYVRPLEGSGERRTFYLDRYTLYRVERKKKSLEDVRVGNRVGIRYVSSGDLSYAEGVFVILGEINPRDLQMPKKRYKLPPKENSEEKKEGEKKEKKEH
jgi:hypothetical protein